MLSKLKDISLTFTSNVLATLISMIVTFILPKVLGIGDYSYFQLYIFYFSYVGLLHFGWADGVFLRYGGAYYEKLDKRVFHSQICLYAVFQAVVCAVLFVVLGFGSFSTEKTSVFVCVIIAAFFANIRFLVQYIFQGTGRIKEYALMVIVDKLVYVCVVFTLLLLGFKKFIPYIIANIIGVVFALMYGLYNCRDILVAPSDSLSASVKEAKENLVVGIKLMLAQLSSQLIIGIVRQAIEIQWSIEEFGKVSLSLSISNMLMLLINAIAVVLFPMLRRIDSSQLAPMYEKIRSMLMIPLFFMLIFYYPGEEILLIWLPQYAVSLKYLALLFPICIFESKMSMLVNTYLKTLRKEKSIMYINGAVMGLSFLFSLCTVFLLKSVNLAVFSIIVLLAIRSVVSEITLSRVLNVSVIPDILAEFVMVTLFILANWTIGGIAGFCIYIAAYAVYCYVKRKSIINLLAVLKCK